MKPSDIISLARRQTWCTTDIATEEEAYHFLNFVIEDFWAELRLVDSSFWLRAKDINITSWTRNYTLDDSAIETEWAETNVVFWISKIKRAIYNKDYIPVESIDNVELSNEVWTPTKIYLKWNEIILDKIPEKNWELTIIWYVRNPEIIATTTDIEDVICIPSRWHWIIIEWLKYWMYWNMWVWFEQARMNARNFYDSEKLKAISQMTDRWELSPEWEDLYIEI